MHYSVGCDGLDFSKAIIDLDISIVNIINRQGHSPLTIFVKGELSTQIDFTNNAMFNLLVSNKANINILYPESGINSFICNVCAHEFNQE